MRGKHLDGNSKDSGFRGRSGDDAVEAHGAPRERVGRLHSGEVRSLRGALFHDALRVGGERRVEERALIFAGAFELVEQLELLFDQ